jgi:SAM-dependent methyltransferase
MRRIKQISTFEDPAMVAAWRRSAASRASYLAKPTARMLAQARIAPGHRVLVVGAGIGDEALAAASRVGPDGEVVAIDVSAAMIAEAIRSVAAAQVDNVRCLVMDGQHLKFTSGAFNAVISRNTLMFIPDLTLALTEMNRVLKPKGRLAVTVWASARRNPRLSGPLEAARALGVKAPPMATFRIASRLAAPSLLATALRGTGFLDVVVERWPVVARFDTVDAAVQQAMDHAGTRELMEFLSHDSERRMSRSLAQRWQKYAGRSGVKIPGEQLVAAGAKPA